MNRLFLRGRLVGVKIANGDETDQAPATVDDGKVADAAVLHRAAGFIECRLGSAADDLRTHDLFHARGRWITALAHDANEHVAFAEHAFDMVAIHHDNGADAPLIHEQGGVDYRCILTDAHDVRAFMREQFFDRDHRLALPQM
jgi:hypothetical protein